MTGGDAPMPPIDIRPEHWAIVRAILQKHVPDHEVWAFGSRAKGKARPYSDLDLAVIGDTPLPTINLELIHHGPNAPNNRLKPPPVPRPSHPDAPPNRRGLSG